MANYAAVQLFIYDVSDTDRPAVLNAIWDAGLSSGRTLGTPTTVDLGAPYSNHDAPLGTSTDLARALLEQAPSATFELWQDAFDEIGHYVGHVPRLGVLDTECDGQGRPVLRLDHMVTTLSGLPDGTTVASWLASADGPAHAISVLTRLRALNAQATQHLQIAPRTAAATGAAL